MHASEYHKYNTLFEGVTYCDSDETTADFGIDTGDIHLEHNVAQGAQVLDPCFIQFEFSCPETTDNFVQVIYVGPSVDHILRMPPSVDSWLHLQRPGVHGEQKQGHLCLLVHS